MKIEFKQFEHKDYQKVCDFFVELNKDKKEFMNWNWARWEWGYFHPEFDKSLIPYIGIWTDLNKVVGVATFDMYLGEAFCGALPSYEWIIPDIVDYAVAKLSDKNGVGITVSENNETMKKILLEKGFEKNEQCEPMLCISLDKCPEYALPRDFRIQEIHLPKDSYAYQLVLWKGFDHGDDMEEFEKSLKGPVMPHPHMNSKLTLAVVDSDGNYLAHCGCWYEPSTDYAYVEPVCVVPKYRNKGIGKAVVSEALKRCRELGAKEAYVLSDQDFYKSLGFKSHSLHNFYWKR